MAIERDIHRLLYQADCVIVPGFGGFITHRRSARLDEARRLIHPPAKELSFNRRLTRNDGLLADRVAERGGISHEKAVAAIDEEVKRWIGKIASEGRIELQGIGTIFRGSENDLQFTPDPASNYLKDAFGLRTVPAVPIAKALAGAVVRELPRAVEDAEERRIPLLWAAAAVAALLFGAGAWFAYRSGVMDGTQLGSFQLFGPREPAEYQARSDRPIPLEAISEEEWSAPTDVHGILPLPIAGSDGPLVSVDLGAAPIITVEPSTEKTVPAAPDKTAVAVPVSAAGRYHVVGGCFSIKENADNFIAALRGRGFAATLIDQHHGLYRVAFGSYPERAMALEALSAVRKQDGADAWLLVK